MTNPEAHVHVFDRLCTLKENKFHLSSHQEKIIPRPALRTKQNKTKQKKKITRKQICVPYEYFAFPANNFEISGKIVVYDIHVIQT